MSSGTSSAPKRNSFHKLSHIFQLASPTFPRPSFDSQRKSSARNKLSSTRLHDTQTESASSLTLETRELDFAPAESIISASNSSLSSPHTPLLATSSNTSTADLLVPPTTNDLAAEEKAKLIRKARKISRVLGEVPIPTGEDERRLPSSPNRLSSVVECPPSPSTRPSSPLPSPSSKMSNVSTSAKQAFRRSLTFVQIGGSSSLQVQEVQRSKSFSALRPSLNIPFPPYLVTTDAPLFSPISFTSSGRDVSSDLKALPTDSKPIPADSFEALEGTLEQYPSLKYRIPPSVTPNLSAQRTREQIQRQRVAKLAQQFGDTIPPDVLFRAVSPPPQETSATSLYSVREPSQVLSADHLPQRSSSLRGRSTRQRPASLEFKVIHESGITSAPVSPLGSSSSGSSRFSTLQREKFSRPKRVDENVTEEVLPKQPGLAASTNNPELGEPLTEKQRILNVKRAKKLTQLFGDNPPTTLFQITNFEHLIGDGKGMDGISSAATRPDRDSVATIISISASSLSSLYGTAPQKLRDSFVSIPSTSDISALMFAQEEEKNETMNGPIIGQTKGSVHLSMEEPRSAPPQTDAFVVPLFTAASNTTWQRNVSPTTSPNHSRPTSLRGPGSSRLGVPSPSHNPPRTPPTPPPFSNCLEAWSQPPVAAPAYLEPTSVEFQARRRRATKLSKFFGVEVNALVDILPGDVSSSRPSCAGPADVLPPDPAICGPTRAPSVTVAKTRTRYVRTTDTNDAEELDMTEVIEKLRRMKSH